MQLREFGSEGQNALEKALGYLNFSSGISDPQFLANVNLIFKIADSGKTKNSDQTSWSLACQFLREKLGELKGTKSAFENSTQVEAVLTLLTDHVLPGYLTFHRDLLFHQTEDSLFNALFLGRAFEAVLAYGGDWSASDENLLSVIAQLNDFVGYRPVPTLETQRFEAYPHEKVRPVPLYIKDVGVGHGPYEEVIRQALELLGSTDDDILRAAFFNPDQLQELAIDPRSFDFEHPVNKRPNYHFGQWDPHAIDNKGFYFRFVVQQVTLNALMQRASATHKISKEERIAEAAAVLAGTVLMASGISGSAPDSHDSNTSLGSLLPSIAGYRDAFYERLIQKMEGEHRDRLEEEAKRLRQPFGAARQDLNSQLTTRRASQLEHVRLAGVFARMGYPTAAQRKIDAVPVTSARLICQIECNLSAVQQKVEQLELASASDILRDIREIMLRGIDCGAIIDPWNILAFDGNFSLFPHIENSVHDHRVEQLVEIVDEICDMYSRLWSAAAAVDDKPLVERVSAEFREFSQWWRKYAVHETTAVQFPDPEVIYQGAQSVANALSAWHLGGEATGDIKFWAPHVEGFDTPRSYQLVIQMLLEREDFVASRGLLAHWLDQAERVDLEHGEASFQRLAAKWLCCVLKLVDKSGREKVSGSADASDNINWKSVRKFFDYLDANAGDFWNVPSFEFESSSQMNDVEVENESEGELSDDMEDDDDGDDLFSAAYEDVVYRDSTDDGMESSIYDNDGAGDDQLDEIHDQIVGRLTFLNGLCRLRKIAAIVWFLQSESADGDADAEAEKSNPQDSDHIDFCDTIQSWWNHIVRCREDLESLLGQVSRYRLNQPTSDFLSMAEFDRQRMIRESLLEHIIVCTVEVAEAAQFILAIMPHSDQRQDVVDHLVDEDRECNELLRCILAREFDVLPKQFELVLEILRRKAILYVPLSRGGNPKTIISVRIRQQSIRTLLGWLPRLGMLTETRELIETSRHMERAVPSGPGSVTEFDDLFEVGYRSMVEAVIRAIGIDENKDLSPSEPRRTRGQNLVSCLETMTESMLVSWLSHSRTLRLSVLEKIKGSDQWDQLVDFIKRYGRELFTQQFLSIANIRALLYQGVDAWLEQLEEGDTDVDLKLLADLDTAIPREDAVRLMTVSLEAVVENYAEYRDYNSTTTQSDRGDLLFNLLDFLRLLSNYERVVWNLKPVVLSHELLVRDGCNEAAQMWRRALAERISDEADRYIKKLNSLQKKYAMRLSTIAYRLNERFLRPMIIDRMRALVEPSMSGETPNSFEILEEETALLMRDPSGIGFEPPHWLLALEEEVHRVRSDKDNVDEKAIIEELVEPRHLTIESIDDQLDDWDPGEQDLS